MHPYFNVLGKPIPAFGLMVLLGSVAAFALTLLLRRKTSSIPSTDFILCGLFALAFAMIGAFLLKPIIKFPSFVLHWRETPFLSLFGEIVFYGGLLGGIGGALVYCRIYKISFVRLADGFAPGICIGHAFGRIGCFLGGCCYGIEVADNHPFAVHYPQAAIGAPAGIPLLAVPLLEAGFLALLCACTTLVLHKSRRAGTTICFYLVVYGVWRFCIEWFRGDLTRGIYGWFSTSQYISFGLVICAGLMYFGANKSRVLRGKQKPPRPC